MALSKTTISSVRKCFIASIVFLPMIYQYATPIPGFTVGDAFMLLSWLFLITKEKIKIQKSLIFIFLYVLVSSVYFLNQGALERPTTSLRYIVYLLMLIYLPTVDGNRDYTYKLINIAGIVSMIVLYLQYFVVQTTGIIIPGVLTFLPLTDVSLEDYSANYAMAGRCFSVFDEPSHYAIYIILFIAYRLFSHEGMSFKQMIVPLIASISVILCSSFTGIIMMGAVWGLKVIFEMKSGRLSLFYIVLVALAVGVVYYITTMTTAGSYVTDADIYEKQSMGRFVGYEYVYEEVTRTSGALLYGNGMNDIGELEYLSGWPRLVYYYGIIGSIIYILSFAVCAKWNTFSFILIIVVAGLMVGTEMNFGPYMLPYMLLLLSSKHPLFIKKGEYAN